MLTHTCSLHLFYSELSEEVAEITPARVTQGATVYNNEECCAAAHATDKDLSTHAVTKTDNGGGWLKLEFGKNFCH